MKKNYTLMLLLTALMYIVIFSDTVFAQTTISGLIISDTTWTTSGSPYIITGNALLDSSFTLTIEPGVIVKFNSKKSLQISGTLRAIGNAGNKITFTSNAPAPAPGDWEYILFNTQSSDYETSYGTGSIMEYCIVEYGGGSTNGTLQLNGAYPFINYCTFRNNSNSGISLSLADRNGTFSVTNSIFENNVSPTNGGGINLDIDGDTINNINITNCTFSNNSAQQGGAVFLNGRCNQSIVSGNTIFGNSAAIYGGGIYMSSWEGQYIMIFSNNTVYDNTAGQDGGGIYSNDTVVINNIIYNNKATGGGGGISAHGSSISNNVIAHNSAGTYGAVYLLYHSKFFGNHIIDNTAKI